MEIGENSAAVVKDGLVQTTESMIKAQPDSQTLALLYKDVLALKRGFNR